MIVDLDGNTVSYARHKSEMLAEIADKVNAKVEELLGRAPEPGEIEAKGVIRFSDSCWVFIWDGVPITRLEIGEGKVGIFDA